MKGNKALELGALAALGHNSRTISEILHLPLMFSTLRYVLSKNDNIIYFRNN